MPTDFHVTVVVMWFNDGFATYASTFFLSHNYCSSINLARILYLDSVYKPQSLYSISILLD